MPIKKSMNTTRSSLLKYTAKICAYMENDNLHSAKQWATILITHLSELGLLVDTTAPKADNITSTSQPPNTENANARR